MPPLSRRLYILTAALLTRSSGSSSPAECADTSEHCATWARQGECRANPAYMASACRRSCLRECGADASIAAAPVPPPVHTASVSVNANGGQQQAGPLAVNTGDAAATFRRALDDFAALAPTVLSSEPGLPVLQLDAFATEEEVSALLRLTASAAWHHSELERGSSRATAAWRTSSSASCAACVASVPTLFERAANVTRVPLANFETTQLVEYAPQQYYKMHSDYLSEQARSPAGPRVYTLLVYLTDGAEGAGGETVFKYARGPHPSGMLHVAPRRGRALLWPNTLDAEPLEREPRGFHAGAPLRSGRKVAVNQWIRQRAWSPGMP